MRNRMNRFESLPTIDDLTAALGLGHRRSLAAELAPAAGLFACGFLLGAVTAILLAPKAGAELRSELGERVGELRRRGRESGDESPVLTEP